MTDCVHYSELISRLIDNDLNENEHAALTEHIQTCDECRSLYNAFSDVSSIISTDLVDAPENFSTGIMSEIRRTSIKPVKPFKKYSKLISLAVSVAAIAAIAIAVPNLTMHRSKATNEFMTVAAPALVSTDSSSISVENNSSFINSHPASNEENYTEESVQTYSNTSSEVSAEKAETSKVTTFAKAAGSSYGNNSDTSIDVAEDIISFPIRVYSITGEENCSAVSALFPEDIALSADDVDIQNASDSFDISLDNAEHLIHVYIIDDSVIYAFDNSQNFYSCSTDISSISDLIE